MATEQEMHRLFSVVDFRHRIQFAASQLLFLLDRDRPVRSTSALANNKYEILVAVAFSLWRAVFLADGIRDWEAILANAETFLEKLIRDNIINYSDDWNSRHWSFLYYLNNARFRLRELAEIWPEFKALISEWKISDVLDQPVVGSDSLRIWHHHCRALELAIGSLTDQAANPPPPKRKPKAAKQGE